jgi:asparagine synthase (glutamine-hydrolysing)
MCGIAGLAHRSPLAPVSQRQLLDMQASMNHRGPNDSGVWTTPGVGLASLRLAILDLSSRGHMPMTSPDGRYTIVYNGEIYNYKELRVGLESAGEQFRSDTDTEVLLRLFARQGPDMLNRLNGMFAFAVWDCHDRSLLIARDRLGIKPVYYSLDGDLLLFASEEKALFAAGVRREFDRDTWDELLCFRYTAGARTPFLGVQRLLPGHYLRWRAGDLRVTRWWHLAERAHALRDNPPANPVDWYRETFDEAVSLRLISDVPVGVLLSGGLDSSSVATSAARGQSGLASFTVRFAEADHDESRLARVVADASGLSYHDLTLAPDQLFPRLYRASYLADEPLAHSSDVHLLAIAEYAKPRVTVLLSGEGSDETLGGYVRYQALRYAGWLRLASPAVRAARAAGVRGRIDKLARFLNLATTRQLVLFNACEVLPDDLARLGRPPGSRFAFRETIVDEGERLYPGDPVRQAMYSDQHTFLSSLLHRNDRMTMGASIECRVPFLDYRLVEGAAALPSSDLLSGHQSKPLLRQALGKRLPTTIQSQRKWGFAVPWNRYLRTVPELRDRIATLPTVEPIRSGPFDAAKVRAIVRDFLAGDSDASALVVRLFMIAIWFETCVQRRVEPRRLPAAAPESPLTVAATGWSSP